MESITEFSSWHKSDGKSTDLSSEHDAGGKRTDLSSEYDTGGKRTDLSSEYDTGGKRTDLSSEYDAGGKRTDLSSEHDLGVEGSVLGGSMQQENGWSEDYPLDRGDKVGDYTIVGAIRMESGEAQVFIGEKDSKQYAIKIYRKKVSLKEEVVELLVGKEYPYLSYMVETGKTKTRWGINSYEISPLYQGFDRPVSSYRELIKLIEQVNEGLHTLHKMNIFHKDIKPANILIDENGDYRIIDFGLSSVADDKQSHLISKTGMSFAYASPETRARNEHGARQDYYSLGISLYELYMGEIPYEKETDTRYYTLDTEGVNCRDTGMPQGLIKLIHGLTYSNSDPETNKKRWGYEQVKKWLENPDQMEDLLMIPGANASSNKKAAGNSEATLTYEEPFGFNKKQIFDSYTLADELGSHWAEGMKQVGRGNLRDFFKENKSKYNEYTTACEDARIGLQDSRTEMERNKIFWELLYVIEPKLKKFYWHIAKADGTTGYTCEELGAHLCLEAMENRKTGETIPDSIRELAGSGLLPIYLKEQLHDEERCKKAEKLLNDLKSGDAEIAAWRLGYLLVGKALFYYNEQMFETREQLYQYIVEWTDSLSTDKAVEVARNFAYTKEFQAWIQSQEDKA